MEKENYIIDLFQKAVEFQKLDDRTQKGLSNFCDILAGGSYPPIIENTNLGAFLECLKICNKELYIDFERFFYDKPMREVDIEAKNKTYTIENENDFLNYLIEIYAR